MVNKYSIFFGDASTAFNYKQLAIYRLQAADSLAKEVPFNKIYTQLNLTNLMLMHQVHDNQGIVVTHEFVKNIKPFSQVADFSITNCLNLGLAIATADCAPVILYDPINHACAAIHAGWRGAVAGVINNAITALSVNFGSSATFLRAFIGPTANDCCYEVGNDVAEKILQFPFGHTVLFEKNLEKKYMFDLKQFCYKQLIFAGVCKTNICIKSAACTVCNNTFCSFRRDGNEADRQLTIISLQ